MKLSAYSTTDYTMDYKSVRAKPYDDFKVIGKRLLAFNIVRYQLLDVKSCSANKLMSAIKAFI